MRPVHLLIISFYLVSCAGAVSYNDMDHLYNFEYDFKDSLGTEDLVIGDGDPELSSGWRRYGTNSTEFDGDDGLDLSSTADLGLTDDMSYGFWFNSTTIESSSDDVYIMDSSDGSGHSIGVRYIPSIEQLTIFYRDNVDNCDFSLNYPLQNNEEYFLAVTHDSGAHKLVVYLDGVELGNVSTSSCVLPNVSNLYLGRGANIGRSFTGYIDHFFVYDGVLSASDIVDLYNGGQDLAPAITEINFTSEGGQICGAGSYCGQTDDTTPTFRIKTDEPAWCRISSSDQNYSTMGSSRDCNSGQGTTELTCTLISEDALSLGRVDYVYISCKDQFNNENITEIGVDLGGDESNTMIRRAILSGVSSSSVYSGNIYEDQQVYLRYKNNTEQLAVFDVVVSYGGQYWLLNYYNHEPISAGSIGAAVNVWENTSLSETEISAQVQSFIDATRK